MQFKDVVNFKKKTFLASAKEWIVLKDWGSSAELWRLPLPGWTMAGWHEGRKMVHWDEWEKIYWKERYFSHHLIVRHSAASTRMFHLVSWHFQIFPDSFCTLLAFGSIKVYLRYLLNFYMCIRPNNYHTQQLDFDFSSYTWQWHDNFPFKQSVITDSLVSLVSLLSLVPLISLDVFVLEKENISRSSASWQKRLTSNW